MTQRVGNARHPVAGVTIPLVTALDEQGEPDADAARPLLAHLAAGGITTLMLAGTNGEGPVLPADAVRSYTVDVNELWREMVGAPARILATAAGAGTRDTLVRLNRLADLAVDAVVVLAPFYFRHTEPELRAHFLSTASHGLPVVVYNSPGYTGNPLTVSLLRDLLDEPNIIGLKDSSGDAALFAGFCEASRDRPDFLVAQGAERQLADGVRHGAAGLVPGVGMLAPALCVELLRLARAGDHAAATQRQHDIDRLTAIFGLRPGASGVVTVKTALHLLGLCPPHAAPPFQPCTRAELTALRDIMDGLADLLPRAPVS
jgi:4-hydroxy-tetrahydrodipicolinate synthase